MVAFGTVTPVGPNHTALPGFAHSRGHRPVHQTYLTPIFLYSSAEHGQPAGPRHPATFSVTSFVGQGVALSGAAIQHKDPLALIELLGGTDAAVRGRHRKLLRHHPLQLEQLLRHGGD